MIYEIIYDDKHRTNGNLNGKLKYSPRLYLNSFIKRNINATTIINLRYKVLYKVVDGYQIIVRMIVFSVLFNKKYR